MDGQTDGQMDGWSDGRTKGRTDPHIESTMDTILIFDADLAALLTLPCLLFGFLGSGPDKGQSSVELGEIPYVCTSLRPSVNQSMCPSLHGLPARPLGRPTRPQGQPSTRANQASGPAGQASDPAKQASDPAS